MRFFLDSVSGRLRAPWRLLAQYAVFFVAAALLTSLFAIAWVLVNPAALSFGSTGPSSEGFGALFFISSFSSMVAVLASLFLAGLYLDRRPFRDFGFHLSGGWFLDLFFGMLLGAFLMTAIFLVQLSLGWVSVTDTLKTVGSGGSFALAILLPIGVFVCVGVYEEALSRGYQLRNAAEGLNLPALDPRAAVLLAWILSSVVFGLLHAYNPNATAISTFNIVLAGLMLGAGFVLTGELAIPIGLHITWNFFQGNVYGFPVSGFDTIGATFLDTERSGPDLWTGGPFGPEAGLLGLLTILLGTILVAAWVRLRKGELALHTPLAESPVNPSTKSPQSPVKTKD